MSWFKSIRGRMIVIMLLLMMAAMMFIGLYLWISLESFYNETHTRTMEQATYPLQFSAREFLLQDQAFKSLVIQIQDLQRLENQDVTVLQQLENRRDALAVTMVDLQENLSSLVRASAPTESEGQGESFQLAVLDTALKPVAKTVGVNCLDSADYSVLNQTLLQGTTMETHIQYMKADQSQQDMKILTFPVTDSETGKVLGMIYVESGIGSITSNLQHVRSMVVVATFGSMLIIGVVASVMAGTITGPIRVLNSRAKEMATGDFNSQIAIQSEDEVGELGRTFNGLSLRLRDTLTEIADEKSKMEAMLNFMTEGVIAIDHTGKIIHINPAACKMFHLPVDHTGQLLDALLPAELYHFAWRQALANGETVTKEIKVETPNANDVVLRSHAAPFSTKANERSSVVIVLLDMTEENKLEEMRRDFVANVSHELRTPLTTVRTYVETLKDGALHEPELAQRFLGVVINETDRMTRLVNDLLHLTRLDSISKWEPYFVQDLKEIIHAVSEVMELQFAAKEQNFSMVLPVGSPKVNAVQDKIQQVLINILANANLYTPARGSIYLSLTEVDDGNEIMVQDTGIGIPKESMERIFERFYRVDKARSREKGGNGLGLSIARQIVDGHGGRISLESEYGVGTTVRIWLPKPENFGAEL